MNGDRDRLAALERAFREPGADAAPATACPDAETLRAAVTLEAGATVRRDVLDHVAVCPACSVAWDTVREIAGTTPRTAGADRPFTGRAMVSLAAAAMLAIAFLVLPDAGTDRVPVDAWRTIGTAIDWSAVPDEVPLTAAGGRLSWPAGPEGTRYRIRLTTTGLDPLASAADLVSAAWEVPAESVASIAPGTVLLWQVEATTPDGSRSTSPTFRARVDPQAP